MKNIINSLNIKFTTTWLKYDYHFVGDKEKRHIFRCTLSRNGNRMSVIFGQSIVEDANKPDLYSVLACLQKYEVGSFEDFCGDFGYNIDSRSAYKIYKAVCKEWVKVERVFGDCLETLQEIW